MGNDEAPNDEMCPTLGAKQGISPIICVRLVFHGTESHWFPEYPINNWTYPLFVSQYYVVSIHRPRNIAGSRSSRIMQAQATPRIA